MTTPDDKNNMPINYDNLEFDISQCVEKHMVSDIGSDCDRTRKEVYAHCFDHAFDFAISFVNKHFPNSNDQTINAFLHAVIVELFRKEVEHNFRAKFIMLYGQEAYTTPPFQINPHCLRDAWTAFDPLENAFNHAYDDGDHGYLTWISDKEHEQFAEKESEIQSEQ